MHIALDYDDTYNADKLFWNLFIELAKKCGHEITIVTMRSSELDWHTDFEDLKKNGIHTIFCDGEPKRQVCEALDIDIDIWIDDRPEGIGSGSTFSSDQLDKWREEQKACGKITDKAA